MRVKSSGTLPGISAPSPSTSAGDVVQESDLEHLLQCLRPTHIIIGPGPGRPEFSAVTMMLARSAVSGCLGVPCLGICLGHQVRCCRVSSIAASGTVCEGLSTTSVDRRG